MRAEVVEIRRGAPAPPPSARRHGLESLEHGEDVDDRLARQRRHGGADVGTLTTSASDCSSLQRLAHRDDAHLELARQIVDDEPLTRAADRSA